MTTFGTLSSITASLPKRVIQALESRPDVGRIFLIEAKPQVAMDIAVPTDRVPGVWRQGFDGTGSQVAMVELGVVEFNATFAECPAGTNHCFLHPGGSRDGWGGDFEYQHAAVVASAAASNYSLYKGVAPGATIYSVGMTTNTDDAELNALKSGG